MAITSDKDIRQLKKRFAELAEKSYQGNHYTFTDFLGLPELSVFYDFLAEYGRTAYEVSGGHELCERKMVRFGSPEELLYEQPFPIVCIRVCPLLKKFADELNHRDFLGAIMNLGIDRSTCGDIFVQDREAYLYAQEAIAPFLIENLTKVKHTSVKCGIFEDEPALRQAETAAEEYLVSSVRIDGVLAKIYKLSRSQSILLFQDRKVFVSGRLCTGNSYQLKPQDAVAVRGFGKFVYQGISGESRKGKLNIRIDRYLG